MIAEIIVDVASSELDRVFEYLVPPHLEIKKGHRVLVPFGPRKIVGFVLNLKENASTHHTLKPIIEIKPNGHIIPEMLELCAFMVEKYFIKWVDALRLCLKTEIRTDSAKEKLALTCALEPEFDAKSYIKKLPSSSIKQALVLKALENAPEKLSTLSKQFGLSAIKTLEKKGALKIYEQKQQRTPLTVQSAKKEKVCLNADQKNAIAKITSATRQTFVLFGVTGSGKTEVYLNCIESVLEKGKTAILLVPEISLTPQVFGLLEARFGKKVAVLHSGLSSGEKFDEWQRISSGEAKVVVGARSAIFAPLENVGLIIIDEEHESSYNSDSNPRYRTEDVALFRAKYNSCPLVLGSATPSIETFQKTVEGTYALLSLPSRVHDKPLPETLIIDMGAELRRGNDSIFSMALMSAMTKCIQDKKQIVLFLNRRGFTSFMRCMECGFVAKCTDCDAPLVYHKHDNVLKCHFCGKKFKVLTECPDCHSPHIRQGALGTQKVVEEVQKLFPNVPIFRMDNDTTSFKGAHQKILEEFSSCSPAILVGTQMIAKGHDFENVDVVGVLDADQTLYQTDFKSAERTFELITQVSGRAGRKNGGGKVFLQTYNPRHYVYNFVASGNYKGFFEREINAREVTNFPPFAEVVRILVSHEKEDEAYKATKSIFDHLKPLKQTYGQEIVFLGAMASPFARLKNKFRFQVVLRFTKQNKDDIIAKIHQTVNAHTGGKLQIFVEVSPSSLA